MIANRMRPAVFWVVLVLLLVVIYRRFQTMQNREVDMTMESFRVRDIPWVDDVLKLDPKSMSETDAMNKFYYYIAFPVQGVCRVLKRIGGSWIIRQVDGDKFVCMDNLMLGNQCLIYSFGVAHEYSFEEFMDSRGCEIHAYDPTVDHPAKLGQNIYFTKLGLSNATSENMDTLANILTRNGHTNTVVEYLKIDIEGHELSGFSNWLATGALRNVNQMALELHMTELHKGPKFIWLLEILQELYKLDFRVISHEVNMVMGPGEGGLYNLVEVVFMKDNIWNHQSGL
eukprot:TRINITY_DN11142_c0_g1_i1.p1 TRINITY_DN11142_c0_g1~~TRINITY_DN11142_c0_g1_i1.p1  ORF type:complete len:285 (+),score=58.91 TRINITY_DN11142_c0_g1_i1:108-962(+)